MATDGKAKRQSLTWAEKICYSFGDCGGQIYVTLCTYFLTGYYTDTVGIAAAAVGTMMIVARVFDGTSDLFMGAIIDKTKTRFGKARPWILWTAPLMAIALVALFWVPDSLGNGGKLAYAYISYILLNCIIYTANGVGYNALLARMTLNPKDRVHTTSIRFVLGNIVAVIVNAITASLVTTMGWRNLVIIYAAVLLALMLICFFGCKEHIGETDEGTVEIEKVPLKVGLKSLLKNKYFPMQVFMLVFLYINIMTVGSMTYYFCNSVLGSLAVMTVITMFYNIATIVGSLINPVFSVRFGKRKVLIVCFILSIIGRAVVGIGGTALVPVIIGVAIHGLALGPIYSNVFAMTPDIVDYGEWKTGVRAEGLTTCCVSFGMKVGIGVGGAVATWVLAIGGYVGTAAEQTASAISAIKFGFGWLSTILSIVCLVLVFFMNIDKDLDKIQADLTAKHNAA